MARSRPVDVSVDDLSRWEIAGRRLERIAPSLLVEIHAIWIEPNRVRISLAANAARYASWIQFFQAADRYFDEHLAKRATARQQ